MVATVQKRAARERVIQQLLAHREENVVVGRIRVEQAAAAVGCSPATLYRDLNRTEIPPPNGRESYTLSQRELLAIVAYGGKVKAAYRALCEAGAAPAVKYEAFNKAWRALPEAYQSAVVSGQQKAKRFLLYSEVGRPAPGTLAEIDGWEPNILLKATFRRSDAEQPNCRPHVFALVDRGSEFILGATVKFPLVGERAQMDDEFVAASLAGALRPRTIDPRDLPYDDVELPWDWASVNPAALQVGGAIPTIYHDNAKALISENTRRLAGLLGVELKKVPPYTGEAKPYIERLFGTLEGGYMFLLPGQTHGPKKRDSSDAWEGTATTDDFLALLERVVFEHNYLRPQAKLDGRTPFQVWVEAAPSLRVPDEEVLRPYRMLHPHKAGVRTAQKFGVMVDGRWYQADELLAWTGKKDALRVRIDPQDRSFVDVWTVDDSGNERFLTSAPLNHSRSLKDKRQTLLQNRQLQANAADVVREASQVRAVFAQALRDGEAPAAALVHAIDQVLDPDSDVAQEVARLLCPDDSGNVAEKIVDDFAQAMMALSDVDAVPAAPHSEDPGDLEADDSSEASEEEQAGESAHESDARLTAVTDGADVPEFDPSASLAALERTSATAPSSNGHTTSPSRKKRRPA